MPATVLAAPFDPNAPGTDVPTLPKEVVSFPSLIKTIMLVGRWMFGILMALGVVFIVYAGFLYLIAQGNDTKLATAKKVLIYAIVGLIIGVLAGGVALMIQRFAEGVT